MKIDVKGKVESACVEASFDQALNALKKEKYNLISLEENARLRMQDKIKNFYTRKISFLQLNESYQGWSAYARWADSYNLRIEIKVDYPLITPIGFSLTTLLPIPA